MIEDTETGKVRELQERKRQAVLDRGRGLYRRFCVHCHGISGQGNGEATHYLAPPPRNLEMGIFKFHSTQSNAVPSDDDLLRTLQNGIPGTAMPAWGPVLGPEALQALVAYIKTFSKRFDQELPDFKIDPQPELPYDALSVERGAALYREMRCGRCHGKEGERTGPLEASLNDIWNHTSYVYDLRRPELYKAGADARTLYRTLALGMDGTPMHPYDYLSEDERWHLVHFLQSIFKYPPQPVAGAKREIVSVRVETTPLPDENAALWSAVPVQTVTLIPVQFRKHPITQLHVQSVHNEHHIAFRLQWNDPHPESAARVEDGYLDGAAIQFPVAPAGPGEAPFYGMGERRKPVNIWHWKADAAQPVHLAASTKGSTRARFVNPFYESAVEELNASGFGSVNVQSLEDQQVRGGGEWKDGVWTVVFVRPLHTLSRWDVQFESGHALAAAFAVWDGANRDRNANKMVSHWQSLTMTGD